ncbi:MAG: dihydropteroate synthase [Elusimicrobia bacterium]|nr:dihydropteroate synthase [Elusimicrobiota bacterium]
MSPPRVMAIVNATPDSFYAASRTLEAESAFERCRQAVADGADILDIGGESTRPGSSGVPEREEFSRVVGVVGRAAGLGVPVSIDTAKASVASAALATGASILNDVTALRGDPAMPEVAKRFPTVILMHMQGTPRTMQQAPSYKDVTGEIIAFFRERLAAFERAGGDPARVWLDPGIGFGKELSHNLEILRRLPEFQALGRPVLVGASRKSFVGKLLAGATGEPLPPEERLEGSLAVACRAADAGVDVIRVHDVRETKRMLTVYAAVRPSPPFGRLG